jgi:hypothetical protein
MKTRVGSSSKKQPLAIRHNTYDHQRPLNILVKVVLEDKLLPELNSYVQIHRAMKCSKNWGQTNKALTPPKSE